MQKNDRLKPVLPMTDEIRIRAEILEEMIRHARREPEIECCGLLAGRDGVITQIFPTENALASATAYEIAPQELFQLFRRLREEGLQHLGQYHSHLRSENFPSATRYRAGLLSRPSPISLFRRSRMRQIRSAPS